MDRFMLALARMGVSGDGTRRREDKTTVMALRIHERTMGELPIRLRGKTIRLEPQLAQDCRLEQDASGANPALGLVITVLVIAAGRRMARRTSAAADTRRHQPVNNPSWTRRCTKWSVKGEGAQPYDLERTSDHDHLFHTGGHNRSG
jgi:hypothetical protein